jgi:hypothetical protein
MISGNSRSAKSVIVSLLAIVTSGTLARSQSIDLQEKCALQARMAYQESEREDRGQLKMLGALPTGSSAYQSHYNAKLQKCLMLIDQTQAVGDQVSTGATLTDANERRVYAVYIWLGLENEKLSELPPIVCELIPSIAEKRICTSREEFDAFVAPYMRE